MRAVAVVGAGAVGLTAAYDLARRGAAVTVFERAHVGSGATERAAGIAYDAFADAEDAALATRALDRFREFSGEGGFKFHTTPYVWFVTDPASAAEVRDATRQMADHGVEVEFADGQRLRERFPQFRTDDVAAAGIAERAGSLDPAAYADLLAAKARETGATIRTDTEVAVRADPPRVVGHGEYDAVVVAAGAASEGLLADAGVDVPLGAYRAQCLRCHGPAVPAFYDATEGFYARPHTRGLVAGDGASRADPDAWDPAADEGFEEAMLARLRERLLNLETGVQESWAGLCTATPDGDPLVGPVVEGVVVAAGWHGSGLMRAPAMGEVVADAVLDGVVEERFDPGRFDGTEQILYPE